MVLESGKSNSMVPASASHVRSSYYIKTLQRRLKEQLNAQSACDTSLRTNLHLQKPCKMLHCVDVEFPSVL